jgi:probable rRNA maturation factor
MILKNQTQFKISIPKIRKLLFLILRELENEINLQRPTPHLSNLEKTQFPKKDSRLHSREGEAGGDPPKAGIALLAPTLDLDLTFVNDAPMRRLNREFLKKDKTTDVLSFPLWEKKVAQKGDVFLGDVVISLPTASKQAKKNHKTILEEVMFLVIHGTLHLLGYDHEKSEREEKRMKKKERQLFDIISAAVK